MECEPLSVTDTTHSVSLIYDVIGMVRLTVPWWESNNGQLFLSPWSLYRHTKTYHVTVDLLNPFHRAIYVLWALWRPDRVIPRPHCHRPFGNKCNLEPPSPGLARMLARVLAATNPPIVPPDLFTCTTPISTPLTSFNASPRVYLSTPDLARHSATAIRLNERSHMLV